MPNSRQEELFEREEEWQAYVSDAQLPPDEQLVSPPPEKQLLDTMRENGWRGVLLVTVNTDGSLVVRDGKRRIKAARILAKEGVEPFCLPSFQFSAYCRNWQGLEDMVDALVTNRSARPNRQADFEAIRGLINSGKSMEEIAKMTGMRLGSVEKMAKLFRLSEKLLLGFLRGDIPYTAADKLASMGRDRQQAAETILDREGKLTLKDVQGLRRQAAAQSAEEFAQEMFAELQVQHWPLTVEGDTATFTTPRGTVTVPVMELQIWLDAWRGDDA